MTENSTEKLYYLDSHLFAFDAAVLSCVPSASRPGCFETVLDRTAFFPEGGGQLADTGVIGTAQVLDVQEKQGRILHYTDRELPAAPVHCALNAEQRLRRMQNHSGEHIVSGLVHNAYGYENVGFHMGETCMTIDFSGELSWEQLLEIERRANEAVRANLPIRATFPREELLKNLEYRSKLTLTENVRIVEIEGIDRCACCAPHVSRTGEIGIIKLLTCERHRGGVRIDLICGMDALEDYRLRQNSVSEISGLLSAKRNEVSSAVERLKEERDRLKFLCTGLETELVSFLADTYPEQTEGNLLVFRELSEPACRELVNLLVPKCSGVAAVFYGSSSSAPGHPVYRYIIGSRNMDLRSRSKEINAAIHGRGGGKPEMIMGSAEASREEIEAFFFSMNV